MRPTAELAEYLNAFFAPEVWRPAGNLVGNVTASELSNRLNNIPLVSGFGNARLDFDRPPLVAALEGDRLRVRVPGTGRHRLEGDVVITDPLPDSGLTADFSIEMVVGSNEPVPQSGLSIDFQILTGVARDVLAAANLPLFLQMRGIEEAVEFIAEALLGEQVGSAVGRPPQLPV